MTLLTLVTGLLFTMADFYNMPFRTAGDLMVIAMQFGVVEGAIFLFVWLISCNKYVFAAVFPLFAAVCATAAYFRYTAGVTITPMALELAAVNDMRTSMDVVTWQMVAFACACAVGGAVAAYVRFKHITVRHQWLQLALAACLLNIYMSIPRFASPIRGRIPFVIYYAATDYLDNRKTADENRPAFKGKAVAGSDTIDVVLILGETLRAKNMQANGYQRPTTPYLVNEPNAVSLKNIYSEYECTHLSIPYLLTRACPRNKDAAYKERSFIDIFKQAGYRTTWIANQESVETFAYFMHEADSLVYVNSGKSVYVFSEWIDGDILPELDKQMKAQNHSPRRLFILHTIGSHWWYKAHYPRAFAHWRPELKSRVMSANTHMEFVNSYDNTVIYSDWFWQEVRNRFRKRNAIMIYLSDHSENLGENGIYGHSDDTPPLHYPGCWVWMSDRYRREHPGKWHSLTDNKSRRYNSAFLFHSMLSAGDIQSKYMDKRYDIFGE